MPSLRFHLFGKFAAHRDAELVEGLDAGKDQELLSFLLLRNQHHSREALATLLWGDNSTTTSKKYLRQSLWHLQAVLDSSHNGDGKHLLIEHDWLRVNPSNRPWCDVDEFENAYCAVEGISGKQLGEQQAHQLKKAVTLYRDDLLAGWYQDWVLFERERLQNKYLLLLDKLIAYSESHREYEQGQTYATKILRYDPARERTHRELMRLYYLSGDRTAAIRQYERCANALKRELGVRPERHTIELYEQIRCDQIDLSEFPADTANVVSARPDSLDVIGALKQIHAMLSAVQQRIQRDIRAVETMPRTGRKKL
jgi:DNA-binding SARP family transcriptional activator